MSHDIPTSLHEILSTYLDSEMNGESFALFEDSSRFFGIMKPNEYSCKYHPILVSNLKENTIGSKSIRLIEAKGISLEEVDVFFQNSDHTLVASNFQNPNITIKLSETTISQIFEHFDKVSNTLQRHIEKQSIVSRQALTYSKQKLLSKTRMMFVIDVLNDDATVYLQNLNDIQIDENGKNLLATDTILSNYQIPPYQIKQSKCVETSRMMKLKHSDIRYIKFELDFLDVDILLENNFDTIEILDALATTSTLNSDMVLLRDYVCFKRPKLVNRTIDEYSPKQKNENTLDFKCLILPSYLK